MLVDRICANKQCRAPFKAKSADVKRGWGRFHSKQCKAIEQTRRTGIRGPVRSSDYDGSWDAHEVPR